MKTCLHKILTLSMVICLLVSTMGVAVFSHTCLGSGHTDVSFLPVAPCCAVENSGSALPCLEPAGCCVEQISFYKAEAEAVVKQHATIGQFLTAQLFRPVPFQVNPLFSSQPVAEAPAPPLLSGRKLLAAIHILRT
ncbi:MAG: hypothetical protein M3Q97_06390 [Bacteroidota bacterium]|nr:hypothetical protein [Bacteroidota bacterium]